MYWDGLSPSLSLSTPPPPLLFYMSSWIRVCTYVWCLSGWFVCLIDRERKGETEKERERERDFVVTKRLAIRIRWRRTYCFVVGRYYTYNTGREVPMNIYVWGERKSQTYRTVCCRLMSALELRLLMYVYIYRFICLFSYWNDTCI
jgi:hypothetical protein